MLQDQRDRIVDYYHQTRLDYRFFWLDPDNLAMHFGQYADAPSSHALSSHAGALRHANARLADAAQIAPGDVVLDAGCGLGGSAIWLARCRGARVVGINIVADHVKRATRAAGDGDAARFCVADFRTLPFASASFDVVWACESLCHAARKAEFYAEAYRVLKPGGRIVVAEYIRSGRPLAAAGESSIAAWCKGWAMHDIDTAGELIGPH